MPWPEKWAWYATNVIKWIGLGSVLVLIVAVFHPPEATGDVETDASNRRERVAWTIAFVVLYSLYFGGVGWNKRTGGGGDCHTDYDSRGAYVDCR